MVLGEVDDVRAFDEGLKKATYRMEWQLPYKIGSARLRKDSAALVICREVLARPRRVSLMNLKMHAKSQTTCASSRRRHIPICGKG